MIFKTVLPYIIILLTIYLVVYIDKSKNKFLGKLVHFFPAILFAYVIPAIFTHLFDLDFVDSSINRWNKIALLPLAILTVMSAMSFSQLRIVAWKPILIFLAGSFTIAIVPVFMLWCIKVFFPSLAQIFLSDGQWKGLITMVGSWIGGSTSQLVIKELVNCPEPLFLIILVIDNVLVNIWTILMFQFIKSSDKINTLFKINDPFKDQIPNKVKIKRKQDFFKMIIILVSILVINYFLNLNFIISIISLSFIGLFLGNFLSFWNHGFVIKLGGILIIAIMAILGLKLDFRSFQVEPIIIVFAVIWLVSHLVVMTILAVLLKTNMAWVAISSMANVGGISTAPAVTKAYNEEWMPNAIVLAILSMVTGTYWGILSVYIIEHFLI